MSTASFLSNLAPFGLTLACAGIGFTAVRHFTAQSTHVFPHVDIVPSSVSLGHLGQYASVERVVWLTNPNSTPLHIQDVSVSCGCTTTQAPDLIPPHGRAPLTIHFNALGRNGRVQEEVHVSFAGRESEDVTIPISGTVTREIALSKPSLDLTGKPLAAGTLTLTRLDGKPLNVTSINASHLKIDIQTVSPAVTRLAVSRIGFGLSGTHTEDLTLHLNDPLVPTLTLPVSWTTQGVYRSVPQAVNFGSVTSGTAVEQQVKISGPGLTHLRVASAPPGWVTRLQPTRSGTVKLTLRGSSKGGLLHSSIILATGNTREPNIAIPVYAVFETAAGACSSKPLGNNSSAH